MMIHVFGLSHNGASKKFFSAVAAFAMVAGTFAPIAAFPMVASANPAPAVVINEFASDVTGGNSEWVELYNTTTSSIDLTGWTISDAQNHVQYLSGSISGDGLANFDVSQLNNPGDTITLADSATTTLDSVAYGNAKGEVVGAPGKGESAGRAPDGSSNWVIFSTPSEGASNDNGVITLAPPPTSVIVGIPVSFTAQSSDLMDPTYSVSSADPSITAGDIDPTTGAFSWTPSDAEIGPQTITISATSGTYVESQSVTVMVEPDIVLPNFSSDLAVQSTSTISGSPVTLSATLTSDFPVAGTPIPASNVGFSVNGSFVGTSTTNTSGLATIPYTPSLPAGSYPITANFYATTPLTDSASGSGTLTIVDSVPSGPTDLKFNYTADDQADNAATLACGATVNSNKPTTYHQGGSLNLNWVAPAGIITGYQELITYPNSATTTAYQGPNNWSWLSFAQGNGVYTYQVRADSANGLSAYSAPCTIAYDTQSPTAQFNPAPPEYVNGNFTVSGTASDNVALKDVLFDVRDPNASGNQWVAGCTSGSQTTTMSADGRSATTSCTINTTNLVEGYPYIVRIHASDNAGYGGGQQQTLILDKTRPSSVTITAPADGSTQTGAFTITGTATDTLSGIDHVQIWVSRVVPPDPITGKTFGGYVVDNQPAVWNAGTGTFSYDVSGLADGTYEIKADAFDAAGNSQFAPTPTITVQNVAPVYVTTDAATDVSSADATLNGTNGDCDATGHSFWVSTSTFTTSSPDIPENVYSTHDFGPIAAHTDFSALLSSLTQTQGAYVHGQVLGTMPAITPNTTYYYVAWSDVGGTWYPGAEQSFTTASAPPVGSLSTTTSTVVVSQSDPQGWVSSVSAGGTVDFAADSGALGNGALELTTIDDNDSVAHYTHDFDIPLSDLESISFETKQVSAADTTNGNATLRIDIDTDGDGVADDQLMFEPYYNGFNGTTMTGWQTWSITPSSGKFWSNNTLHYNGLGGASAGSYASNFTLADVLHDYPNAKITGLVLSMGTWNPSQTVLVDDLTIDESDGASATSTTYDFEPRTSTETTITNASDLVSTPSTVNQPFAVEWSVVPQSGIGTPTGTVTVYADGSAASGCSADLSAGSCSIVPTSAGSMTLYALYSGDSTFNQSDTKPEITHVINAVTSNNANAVFAAGPGGSNGEPSIYGTSNNPPTGEVLGAQAYQFTRDLMLGSTGQDVVELQNILINEGDLAAGNNTGFFGPLTFAAVVKYQAAHGISPQSGYVGPLTRAVLNQGSEQQTPTQTTPTQTLTDAQISAILGLLQSFGADQATITNVSKALGK